MKDVRQILDFLLRAPAVSQVFAAVFLLYLVWALTHHLWVAFWIALIAAVTYQIWVVRRPLLSSPATSSEGGAAPSSNAPAPAPAPVSASPAAAPSVPLPTSEDLLARLPEVLLRYAASLIPLRTGAGFL